MVCTILPDPIILAVTCTLWSVGIPEVQRAVETCRRCPRLVSWREEAGRTKRAAYRDWDYWAKPVPGFGDPESRLLIVGLAPAAHGANRTGRMFTGDRSGDWLFRALARAGFANQPEAVSRQDGLLLQDAFISAIVRCAPPDNRPTPEEREHCRGWLEAELDLLTRVEVIVPLGGMAYAQVLRILAGRGVETPGRVPVSRTGSRSICGQPARGWWRPTIPASRTPSPDGSPKRCWTVCLPGRMR